MLKFLLSMFFFGLIGSVAAQSNPTVLDYINSYKQIAINEMLRTGVPASIKLAQGIHETQAGKSELVNKSNNHFGIKCKTGWSGEKVYHDDDERGECFRSYITATESYTDHSDFLKNGRRYAFLFELDPVDYKAWAYGLKKAGYATNTKYSQILIKLIEDYNLQQYSLIALGRISPSEEIIAGANRTNIEIKNPTVGSGPAVPIVLADEEVVKETTYPAGEFEINRTRVIYAPSGTSLLSIAEKNNISIKRLLDFNDLQEEDVLVKGQLIFLQRKRRQGANEIHIVNVAETMYDIAQVEGLRLENLLKYNGLLANQRPAIGEKIYLQSEAPVRPKVSEPIVKEPVLDLAPELNEPPSSQQLKGSRITHVVQIKETLYSIAKYYKTTIENIKAWNRLGSDDIKRGQELVIYKN